jgi:hypothetical protein
MKWVVVAILAALAITPARAQTQTHWIALGCSQLTSLGSATKLTVPAGATLVALSVEGQPVRYRDDGVAPTSSVGVLMPVGGPWPYTSNLAGIQFIQTASSSTIDACFYY